MGALCEVNPTVDALLLCISHWFGPSATGRNREYAASWAILANFSGASTVDWGAQFDESRLLKPSEKASIAAWQIEDLPENPGEDDKSSRWSQHSVKI
jgi:hypothetical protein